MMPLINKYKGLSETKKAALWYMMCSILLKGIALLTTPIFTRILSAEDYGLVSIYHSWADIVIIFISLRLDYSVFYKGMSKYRDDRDGYVASMQAITTTTALLCMLLYMVFSRSISAFTELSFFIMILILLRSAVYPSYQFWMIRERYEYRYKRFVAVILGLTFVNAALGILAVLAFPEKGGVARIVTDFAVYFAIGLCLYIVNFRKGLHKVKKEHIRFALLFNLPLIPHYLSTYVLHNIDRIMIQKMVGIVQAGIYSVAYSAGMMMNIVSSSLVNALTPWYYGKLENNNIGDVKRVFFPLMLCTCGLIFLFMLLAPEALMILAPSEYYEAVYIIPPLSASVIFALMYSFFSIPEFYFDANKFSMFASMGAAIINLVLNFFFIHMFGYLAAGFTTLVSHMFMAGAHYVYVKMIIKRKGLDFINLRQVLFFYFMTIIVVVVMCLIYDYTLLRYSFAVAALIVLLLKKKKILEIIKTIRNEK